MQARQAADRRQRAHGLKGTSQPVSAGSRGQRERRELQPFLQAPGQPVGRRRLDVAAKLRPVRLHQPMGCFCSQRNPRPTNKRCWLTGTSLLVITYRGRRRMLRR